MIDICVCVGSSCHIKGSNPVVVKMKELIAEYNMADQIELRASFCMGECRDGVCIAIDGKKIKNVCASNVGEIFEKEIVQRGQV